ncbi:protein sprint-like isoform X3 [Bolinopsis microptera]|uniref:protein sprint-like isoform X3 n=1 Tax=Bolinopsis microptera TaxID=2820187 RepID=UPI00307A36FE
MDTSEDIEEGQTRKQSFSELVSQFAAEVEEAYTCSHKHPNGIQTLPSNLDNISLFQNAEFIKMLRLYEDESGSGLSDDEPLSPLDFMTDSTSPSKPTSKPDHPSQLPKENHSPDTTSQTTEDNTSRDDVSNLDDDVTCDDVTCVTDNVTCKADEVTCETEDVKQTSTCCAAQQSEGLELELQTSFHVWYQTDLSREHAEELLVKQPIGTFYIRGSSKLDHYALSVHISYTAPCVEHYLVHDHNNVLQMENSSAKFPSFVKLLAFFANSRTYSATTGIPVQLKIPRLISTSGNPTSVYDQIELGPTRAHEQAAGITPTTTTYKQPAPGSIAKVSLTVNENRVSTRRKTHSPPPRVSLNSGQVTSRPKSVHVTCSRDNGVNMKDLEGNASAPPKPPKPKHYRHNYNFPHEKDLIYINLDKGCDKMIEVLSPTPQNDLSEGSKRTRIVQFTYDSNNLNSEKHRKRQGPAVFHAPPPPPTTAYDDDQENMPVFLAASPPNGPVFIPPSPPNCPPSTDGSDEEYELSSCAGSMYSSKNSVDLGSDSIRLRPNRGPRASVMDKVKSVRSRVFKLDRPGRQSVRAKLCQKLSPHVLRLTDSQDFTFAARVNTFVTFVKQQHQKVPDRLLSQIREFMCTIKHELLSYRSDVVEDMVCRAQRKGGPPTKLNDVLEGILVKAVIWPLRSYISKVLHEHDEQEAEKLKNSMTVALSKPHEELGINKDLFCGEEMDWSVPVQCLQDMPNHYSPIKKLERLLASVNSIYTIVRDQNLEHTGVPHTMGADEFLPLFIYVLALSGLHTAGQEVMYMQYLLDPPLLIGEPGYYLTTLASSIILLKSLNFDKPQHILPTVGHLQSMLQIHFTDPDMEEIAYKTLPICQNTTTSDLLATLSTKFRLDHIDNYGLFKVEDGRETLLSSAECPQFIKNEWFVESLERDINSYFTFHRINR